MLAGSLNCACHREKLLRLDSLSANNVHNTRLSRGDSACFIESDDFCSACKLKSLGIFEQNASFCANTASNHYGNRGCESESAGTAYNQNRNCLGQSRLEITIENHPACKCNQGNTDYHRHENARNSICNLCNRRF